MPLDLRSGVLGDILFIFYFFEIFLDCEPKVCVKKRIFQRKNDILFDFSLRDYFGRGSLFNRLGVPDCRHTSVHFYFIDFYIRDFEFLGLRLLLLSQPQFICLLRQRRLYECFQLFWLFRLLLLRSLAYATGLNQRIIVSEKVFLLRNVKLVPIRVCLTSGVVVFDSLSVNILVLAKIFKQITFIDSKTIGSLILFANIKTSEQIFAQIKKIFDCKMLFLLSGFIDVPKERGFDCEDIGFHELIKEEGSRCGFFAVVYPEGAVKKGELGVDFGENERQNSRRIDVFL
jgi:hypothetical protein